MTTPTTTSMTDEHPESGTTHRMSLERVTAQGEVDGLMLTMSLRQSYRNLTEHTLEAVYTFPMALDAVLLGMSAEVGGQRLEGTVLPVKRAERDYEAAIAGGNAPVMVQKSVENFYTANLGNLKPGESMVVEMRYAQLLHSRQDRVQIRLPLTIAPRHGSAVAAGIKPHEAVDSSVTASYPFELSLEVNGALAQGEVSSPSHRLALMRTDTGLRVRLAQDSWLDRDVVVDLLQPAGSTSPGQAVLAPAAGGCVALSSFCTPEMLAPRSAIDLKLLVDCSGSMAGESITQARTALHAVLAELTEADHFSYSRFGTSCTHEFRRMALADTPSLARASAAIEQTDADMGGTQMEDALAETLGIRGARHHADILLITDGDVWDIGEIATAALASHHRIFAIGVGSAPAESKLRQLAQGTGGACELVAPNESMHAAVLRMLKRIRSARTATLALTWRRKPAWITQLPSSVFPGDTFHVFAGFNEPLDGLDASLTCEFVEEPGTHDSAGPWSAHPQLERTEASTLRLTVHARTPPDADVRQPLHALTRIAAWQRIHDAADRIYARTSTREWALDLAIEHQIVTLQTTLLLIHARDASEQTVGMPHLQRVEHMLAAGWGGVGSTIQLPESNRTYTLASRFALTDDEFESEADSFVSDPQLQQDICLEDDLEDDLPDDAPFPGSQSIDELLDQMERWLSDEDWVIWFGECWSPYAEPRPVTALITELIARGMTEQQAQALFLQEVIARFAQEGRPGKAALQLIAGIVQTIPPSKLQGLETLMDTAFASATLQGW